MTVYKHDVEEGNKRQLLHDYLEVKFTIYAIMMSSFFLAVVLILSLMAVQSPGMVQFDESTSLAPSKLNIIDGRKGRFVYSTTVTVIVLSTKV